MKIKLPDPPFKQLLFSLIEYKNIENTSDFINEILMDIINRDTWFPTDSLVIQSKKIMHDYYLEKDSRHFSIWSHPVKIPIQVRDRSDSLRPKRSSIIGYEDDDFHVEYVAGRVHKNITNALCYALIIEALKSGLDNPLEALKSGLDNSSFSEPIKKYEKGDVVELVSGPFKGDDAKITQVDEVRELLIVELLESVFPIPITVRFDQARVIKREDEC